MTRDQANAVLALLTAAPFAKRREEEFNEATVEVWIASLLKLDYDRTRRAVEKLIEEALFMPAIAEVRKRYEDLSRLDQHERLENRAVPMETHRGALTRGEQLANVRRVREMLAGAVKRAPGRDDHAS